LKPSAFVVLLKLIRGFLIEGALEDAMAVGTPERDSSKPGERTSLHWEKSESLDGILLEAG
jgi:hypothetical protein